VRTETVIERVTMRVRRPPSGSGRERSSSRSGRSSPAAERGQRLDRTPQLRPRQPTRATIRRLSAISSPPTPTHLRPTSAPLNMWPTWVASSPWRQRWFAPRSKLSGHTWAPALSTLRSPTPRTSLTGLRLSKTPLRTSAATPPRPAGSTYPVDADHLRPWSLEDLAGAP